MVFIVIVILCLIATFLLISSGIFKNKWFQDDEDEPWEIDELTPGMMGSLPSDKIDVYDSRKPITIPLEGAIKTLVESFRNNANQVFVDFKANKNSIKYKEYIFDDYKLQLLRSNGNLVDDLKNDYFTIRNTIVKDINNIFTYYLDKIKYHEDKSYFMLRREILNADGTKLIVRHQDIDAITNYVLSGTKIPGAIILLLKYKVTAPAQELVDQIVMLAGYNYTTVLEVLEQVLSKEPLPGISILGIVNSSSSKADGGAITITPGFWTQVYYVFKSNNINNFIIQYIRTSFMTEHVYRAILATMVSNMQNSRLTDAMNNIIKHCRGSESRMIKTFPYNFSFALVNDAIDENRIMLKNNSVIDLTEIDKVTTGISNIEKYSNIERNFPVAIQSLKINKSNDMFTLSLKKPNYPILSEDYMVNNYLSFPNIDHQGVYFDRTSAVDISKSGYILITNIATVNFTIGGIIIYGLLQGGTIEGDYMSISDSLVDTNIINNNAMVTVESGKYNTSSSADDKFEVDPNSTANTSWLAGGSIIIPSGRSIRVKAAKQGSVGFKYLRIMAMLIPMISKPISNFLKVVVLHDRNTTGDRFNSFDFESIPVDMMNMLITFDSVYNITGIPPAVVAETFKILNDNLIGVFSRINITGGTGPDLTVAEKYVTQSKTALINGTSFVTGIIDGMTPGKIVNGLVTDTHQFSPSSMNQMRSSYRIKITNNSTTYNPIRIAKLIIFGDINSTNTFTSPSALSGFLNDDNVLYRSMISVFTMSPDEKTYGVNVSNEFIVDPSNQVIVDSNAHQLNSGESIFIEPIVSDQVPKSNQFINVRAMFFVLSGAADTSKLSFSIIKLVPSGINRIATLKPDSSDIWSSNSVLIMFNPIGDTAAAYSNFTILPNTKQEFLTLPKYMEDKFQNDYYDQYYNPVSELTQYPSNFY